jgi:hypothetical protein
MGGGTIFQKKGSDLWKYFSTGVGNIVYTTGTYIFVNLFSYNPETRRLASTQGEIRVGPSHQVSCAVFRCFCEKYTDVKRSYGF